MRFIAGIDESGYGPKLGPLVVASCVLGIGSTARDDGSDVWRRLADCVAAARARSTSRRRRHRRIIVGDSKLVYSPARGHAELERAVLALLGWVGSRPIATPADLFAHLGCADGAGEPWENHSDGRFPLAPTDLPVQPLAPRRKRVRPVAIEARLLSAAEFNRQHHDTRNKATISWRLVTDLLRSAWLRVGHAPMTAVIDRQGGRAYYAAVLADAFPGGEVHTVQQRHRESRYLVRWQGSELDVVVRIAADRTSFPVAVASMVAKYAREVMMARLNGFFLRHAPELRATAGYYGDASRFLRETAALRKRLGVDDARFVRCA